MFKSGISRLSEKICTTLGKDTVLSGVLRFSDSLKIDGTFEGEIDSEGFLYIEKGAHVKADIKVKSIMIAGEVSGDITATGKIEMLSTCRLFGNIKTVDLRIADGVVFKGRCDMIQDADSVNIFSARVEKLKKTVTSD